MVVPMTATAAGAPAVAGRARVFMTAEEALKLAFPKLAIERGNAFLTDLEQKRVSKLSGNDFDRGVVYPYFAKRDGLVVATAYFDTHRVRTLRETVMIVVTSDQKVERVEVLAFGEPKDYLPRDIWYGQFDDRVLDADLNLKRGIRGVAGATLTARATTAAVRRVLAVHKVLAERPVQSQAAVQK
ncbi:MAG: electron transport complex protein RnfG [Chlamydiales bacterium]|jgi:electron transport complex protein RnfG